MKKKITTLFMWFNAGVLTVSALMVNCGIHANTAAVFLMTSAIVLSIYVFGELTKED